MAKAQHESTAAGKRRAVRAGILPVQAIRGLIEAGHVRLAEPLLPDQVQPASLDLRLGAEAYRVRASFLPGAGTAIADKLDDLQLHAIDLTQGAVLETGCVYVVPLLESLALPAASGRRRQPEELDRPARRVHARDRRRRRRVRPDPGRLHGPALRRDLPADLPHRGAAGLAAQRRSASAPAPPRTAIARCVELHAAREARLRRCRPTSPTASPCRST